MDSEAFRELFRICYGVEPFAWQRQLATRVLAGGSWPEVVALPTGAGKTAVLDIAVCALANAAQGGPPAPRRILYVVDRRLVVDTVYARAWALAEVLAGALKGEEIGPATRIARALRDLAGADAARPLEVVRLRGGGFLEREWVRSPAQPTVVVSTVDQIGSRLLFRGYGHGRGETNDLSVQAGLTGCDAIVFLDEAHLSHAFLESARAVAELRTWQDRPVGAPWAVVALTATPREARSVFPEPSLLRVDETESALGPRLRSHKSTTFREVPIDADLPAALADEAEAMVGVDRVRVIAVVANRVLRARAAFERLRQHGQEAILLTGRVRPLDRDRLVAGWLDRIRAGRDRDEAVEPLFVVATQTIEVGADLDFDGVVTEVAALDALRQRLGRLDRLGQRGESPVVVVASKEQLAAKAIDPIYGAALRETGRFLKAAAARAKQTRRRAGAIALNLGWNGLEALLASEGDVGRLVSPASHAPVLLPSHLDLFAQTSPLPTPDPDVAAYLHGLASEPADVRIVWRADLEPDQDDAWTNIVSMCPPQASEGIELPVWTVRRWLAGSSDADAADVEGERASSEEAQTGRRALRWTSPTEAELVEPAEIRPGDTLVVPSEYGGCDAFGWHPTSREPVADLAEEAAGGDFLRLHPRTLGAWLPEEARVGAARGLAAARGALEAEEDGRPECEVLLATLAAAANTPVIRETATAFLNGRWNLLPYPDGVGVVVLGRLGPASAGRGEGDQAAGRPVTLAEHTEGVTRRVAAFARAVDLADSLAADLVLAARLHDLGKCDPRMQAWLHAGDRLAVDPRAPLAKSGMDPRNRAAWRAAREQAGYPRGARHEALSVALVADSALLDSAGDRELVLHLIGSHHGTARPFVPPVDDPDDGTVELEWDGYRLHAPARHGLERLESGVADRFWRLVARYGWWGLAYLEAILRLADWQQSGAEQAGT